MEIENEVKFKISDYEKIKKTIETLTYSFQKESNQEDYYFSPPHKNFAGTKKYYLRLRKGSKGSNFEYHVVKNDLQVEEKTVSIDNFQEMYTILNDLDFKLDCIVKKKRLTYKTKEMSIMLDWVENLGGFLEIEYCGNMNNDIQKEFDRIIKELNLNKKDIVSGVGYPDLLMEKNDKS